MTRETSPDRCDPAALLMAARALVDGGESEILLKEWRRLFARINEPHFLVGVVGEFSRGKSTLINRLLEAEILPVGSIPTTALATRVCYSPDRSLMEIRRDGSKIFLDRMPEIQGAKAVRMPLSWRGLISECRMLGCGSSAFNCSTHRERATSHLRPSSR